MNRTWKYTLLSLCACCLAACILCSYEAGSRFRTQCRCTGLTVNIKDSLENSFVTRHDVKTYLKQGYGEYIGERADSMDLTKIERIIESRSAVRNCEAYITTDGMLHVDITQYRPVVRFQKSSGGFYADASGYIFPLQKNFASRVQIIDGHIPLAADCGFKGGITDPREKEWFDRAMELVNFMERKKEWKSKIVQIHVRKNGDMVLIPRKGNEKFIFGQPEEIEDKFDRIEKYYTTIIPEKGSDRYEEVDLRFRKHIICR